MNIKNKVAIVTGASSGIGLATAKLLTQKGAKVALVARSKEKLEKLSQELPDSIVITADMTKESEARSMVNKVKEHFGKVDILVNNAGQGYDAPVEKMNVETFRHIFNLNVVGPLVAMQEVIPIMKQQKEGSIINISSGTALMFIPNMSAYSSLKRALVGLSLTAREELKEDNINVSVVYPYITATDFEKNTIRDENVYSGEEEGDMFDLPDADPPEYVAERILEAITTEKPEVFAHEWMGNRQ